MRALLVEDESTTRVLLTEVLRARGFAVTPCGTAEEGWEAFRENDYPLVILNWMLPGMSGLDLCRQLRRHPRGETSVVLMVTGRTSPDDLRNALAAGADDYLAKPVDGALLNVRLQVAESRVHEIRQRRRAEDERRKIELKMQQAQKLESLGVLAGGIAHDFNNLLVGILGHAGIVLMDLNQDSPHRHAIEQIERAAVRASELTNQMLAYSGKGQLVVEAVQINDVVQEMANLLLVSKGKAASLVYDFADDLPFIEVDPTQLRQVIMNLITNASDAIGEGPGTIRLTTEMTEVGTNEGDSHLLSDELRPGTYVVLDVSDDGCGMDERTLSRIFDPFFTTKSTGRGLGLAAVMGIIRSHRGGIQVNSAPNRGTSFRVMLPAALRAGDGQFGRRTAVRVGEEWATGGVLVVDPESGVRAVVRVLLERALVGLPEVRLTREVASVGEPDRQRL